MEQNKNELGVIIKAKELCAYIFAVTQKSPKQYRFTFTSKLQNLALSVIENLYRAKDTPLGVQEEMKKYILDDDYLGIPDIRSGFIEKEKRLYLDDGTFLELK